MSETRLSHGPSKGYVHHLESKVRELQRSTSISHGEVPDNSPIFNAIHNPKHGEDLWSASPPVGEVRSQGVKNISSRRNPDSSPHLRDIDHLSPKLGRAADLGNLSVTQPPMSRCGLDPDVSRAGKPSAHSARIPQGSKRRDLSLNAIDPEVSPNKPLRFNGSLSRPDPNTRSGRQLEGTFLSDIDMSRYPNGKSGVLSLNQPSAFMRQIRSAIDQKLRPMFRGAPKKCRESPVLTPTPMYQQPIGSADYVLPPRNTADALMLCYWSTIHPIFPFLDQREFEQAYARIWAGGPTGLDECLTMCTLNVVFALASRYSENRIAQEREDSAAEFFDRAQDLLKLDLWAAGTVQLVQCLLLMSQYLQSINSFQQCWSVTGLALRIAEGLGLHLPQTSAEVSHRRHRELLRQVWHGCVCAFLSPLLFRRLDALVEDTSTSTKCSCQGVDGPHAIATTWPIRYIG